MGASDSCLPGGDDSWRDREIELACAHPKTRQRFEKFVDSSGGHSMCWPWKGRCAPQGYGVFSLARLQVLAHRVAHWLYCGRIPIGMIVRHTCDNPSCVNPAHLLAGTPAANVQDAVKRGRMAKGNRNFNTKLTDDDVRTIREEAKLGKRGCRSRLAKRFSVSEAAISRIVSGKARQYVTASPS
jgi:hypothetical protein